MVFKREFQRCQKKSQSLFEKKNGLITFELWTVAVETYFAESAKYCEQQSFAPVNQSSFLRLLQMVFKQEFQRCQKKSSSLFEQKNDFTPFELWTVAVETYFAESAKNCEQQSFAPVNQSSFLGFYKWYLNESFNDVRRSRRHCLSRRTTLLHLNCGLLQLKRTLRNPQKIVNNFLLQQ